MFWRVILACAVICLSSAAARACGATDTPCLVAGGQYFAAIPDGGDAAPPALLWLHGYAASGRATIASDRFVAAALSRGYAVIAPDGQINMAVGSRLDWNVADGFDLGRDDIAFLEMVRADAISRHGIDPARILVGGYSRGGGMAWDLACARPGFAAAFATHAGGFWAPLPARCAGPVHLLHSHGFADGTLPPEGSNMTFYGEDFTVADIFAGLAIWRRTLGCTARATSTSVEGALWSKVWSDCAGGSLKLELLAGGHNRRGDWPGAAIDWAEGLRAD